MGLKKSTNDEVPNLLATLKDLCDIAYKDDCANDYVKLMFDMTTSHSEFINIMLETEKSPKTSAKELTGQGNSSETFGGRKRELVELLYTLIRKNKSVINSTHVPLYLSSYNGTLGKSDQYILLILQFYETNGIKVNQYRPYLWGSAAATHYSVKGETDTAIWRQPSTTQVLNLFDSQILENTIQNFPVDRGLTGIENYDLENIYDPAFYLPLLCHLLSDNNVVACHKVMQSGALALIFASLASKSKEIRLAGYTSLARFYFHLEATGSKDKLLWMQLINSLRKGIKDCGLNMEEFGLSCLLSTFLARTSCIVTQPLDPLYSPLQNYLSVKPGLDVNAIPEFLHLFNSSDVQHFLHRHWILKVIRDGLKTETDLKIVIKSMLFKMLLDFYNCLLCDQQSKELILEVLCASLRIEKACNFLVNSCGFIPWLNEAANKLENEDSKSANCMIEIIEKIISTSTPGKCLHDHYKLILLKILLRLRPDNSKDEAFVTKYMKVLEKLTREKNMGKFIDSHVVWKILESCRKVMGDVKDCEDHLRYGTDFPREETCQGLGGFLKSFVLNWSRQKTS